MLILLGGCSFSNCRWSGGGHTPLSSISCLGHNTAEFEHSSHGTWEHSRTAWIAWVNGKNSSRSAWTGHRCTARSSRLLWFLHAHGNRKSQNGHSSPSLWSGSKAGEKRKKNGAYQQAATASTWNQNCTENTTRALLNETECQNIGSCLKQRQISSVWSRSLFQPHVEMLRIKPKNFCVQSRCYATELQSLSYE